MRLFLFVNKLILILALSFGAKAQTAQELIASVVILEAGGEGKQGMQAVYEVINNRAKDGNLVKIVLAKKQFSCMNSLAPDQAFAKAKKHINFNYALSLASKSPETCLTHGSIFYYSDSIKPPVWAKNMKQAIKINHHIFLKP